MHRCHYQRARDTYDIRHNMTRIDWVVQLCKLPNSLSTSELRIPAETNISSSVPVKLASLRHTVCAPP
eukprot:scaffold49967_cov47-Prasinocladus_malaysianus.AAC.2